MLIVKNKSTACIVLKGKKAVFLDRNIISGYDELIKNIIRKLKEDNTPILGSNEKDFSMIYNFLLVISEILILVFLFFRMFNKGF